MEQAISAEPEPAHGGAEPVDDDDDDEDVLAYLCEHGGLGDDDDNDAGEPGALAIALSAAEAAEATAPTATPPPRSTDEDAARAASAAFDEGWLDDDLKLLDDDDASGKLSARETLAESADSCVVGSPSRTLRPIALRRRHVEPDEDRSSAVIDGDDASAWASATLPTGRGPKATARRQDLFMRIDVDGEVHFFIVHLRRVARTLAAFVLYERI